MQKAVKNADRLFLGLDSSTQALKALLIDGKLNTVAEEVVNFDRDLPEFKTQGGVHRHADGLTVTSPPIMWVAALDRLLERTKDAKWPVARIEALSVSGQQHGSVWMNDKADQALRGLDGRKTLRAQLAGIFALADSPVWMDSSTGQQCAALEQALGGAQAVATLTGSRAYERFTGNQIARIHQTQPEAYASAECIALVSSFIATLFAGSFVPIDVSDGSGMNLMDIRTKQWSQAALDATAPGLKLKLGPLVPSHTVAGRIHKYFAERFGFSPDCLVVAASGDNPNSLAGLRLQHTGDIALSLGTSDTLFGSVAEPAPSASEGHIFVNPVDPDAYMAMVCIKNGSLTRESVRNESAAGSWEQFQRMLQETRPGNDGNIGFYIREPEITPPILQTGVHRFDGQGRRVAAFASAVECRAVVEGQFMSMRLHGGNIGIRPRSVLATGGASANAAIVKVIADVFGVPVFVGEQPNSAALGAAYRALHGWTCHRRRAFVSFAEVLQGAPPFKKAFDPDAQSHAVYTKMLERYAASEQSV